MKKYIICLSLGLMSSSVNATLNLSNQNVDNQQLRNLSETLIDKNIKVLKLYANRFDDGGLADFSKDLKKTKLKSLQISDNYRIHDSGLIILSRNLEGTEIEDLNLSYLSISHGALCKIIKNLRKTKVKNLSLKGVKIDNKLMKELVYSFSGTGICNVDFSSNSIKDEGIKIFSEGLGRTNIKEITLYGYLKEDTKQLLMESHPTVRWNFSG